VLAPAGTARNVIDLLNADINRALKQTEVRDRLNALGLTPVGGTVAEFSRLYRDEVARWAKVSKEAGVKIE
jgi:tripartite-type tricarboxylate transporter receptor subunit TctC